jgi:hypothetical protein
MYSTTAYLYQQKTRVLMIDTSGAYFTMRYDPVYAKKLTINKGVDNVILFEFINQDQKPVNITGSTMVFRLISQDGVELMNATEMVILNAATGRAKVTLTADALNYIQAQPANYSISRKSGNLTEAVFTDAQAGAAAPVDIVDSIYPEFVPSAELTIPTNNLTAQDSYGGSSSSNYPDWALQGGSPINNYSPYRTTEFYSSFIEPQSAITTIQFDLIGYTGTIKAQAAENYQSIFYNITESTQYLNKTGTISMTIVGWHPLIRLCFNNSIYTTGENGNQIMGVPAQATAVVEDGVVTSINVTYAGQGYQAPPLIEIVGEGAGATAVSTLLDGFVSGIQVVTGGSGYRPVPPTMTSAQVIVSTGHVVNLKYR